MLTDQTPEGKKKKPLVFIVLLMLIVISFLLQQIENLDKAYLEQKEELAALQERLDDLARER